MAKIKVYSQCTNKTGVVGTFLKDPETQIEYSPVFGDFYLLYLWMKENGWETVRGTMLEAKKNT